MPACDWIKEVANQVSILSVCTWNLSLLLRTVSWELSWRRMQAS